MICPKSSSKTLIIIAVVVAIVLGGFFIFKGNSNKGLPASTMDQNVKVGKNEPALKLEDAHLSAENLISVYVDALSRRDTEALYSVMAEPVCQQKEGEEQNTPDYYTSYIEEINRFYGDNAKFSVKINSVEYGAPREDIYGEEYIEDVAFVSYEMIVARDGESETEENCIPCIKIDGKWYVDN